jgi:two-component system LytT family sensor kinase
MQFYNNKQESIMNTLKLQIKKGVLTIIGFFAIGITAFCRPALPDSNRFLYDLPFSSNLGIRFKNNGKIKSNVYEGLRWTSNQPGRSNSFRSIIIDGECSAELCSLDINEKNASEYLYRVVKNFNEPLAPWIRPSVFIASGNSKVKYAFLGQFNYAPRQVLKVEIYNIKNNGLQDAIRIDWQKIEPATVRGFIQFASRGPHFPPDKLVSIEMNVLKKAKGKYNTAFIETSSPKNIKFRLGDSLQNLNFFVVGGWPRFYNYRVILKREIKEQIDSISLGQTNALDETNGDFSLDNFDLNKVYWNNPGKYKLTFIPKITRIAGQPTSTPGNLAADISFTVLPGSGFRPEVSVITLIEVVLVIISIATIVFVYNRIRQRALFAKEMQNRKTATLQLQSIRSQLNPHFIFNALAGIQNLMNKNEIENANKYLTRFARLTRNVLDDGQKELIPIENEIDLLTDYLQMEQMRFGFNFSINADQDIDRQIEIPAMLLQPFAENAVKHGVSALKNKGEIIIGIFKKDKNLRLIVQDNGKGFNDSKPNGMGIRLCEDRIKLLNSIYKNTSILLIKSSGNEGTLITIELNNWL